MSIIFDIETACELYYNLNKIKLVEMGDKNENDGKIFEKRPPHAYLYGSSKNGRENP